MRFNCCQCIKYKNECLYSWLAYFITFILLQPPCNNSAEVGRPLPQPIENRKCESALGSSSRLKSTSVRSREFMSAQPFFRSLKQGRHQEGVKYASPLSPLRCGEIDGSTRGVGAGEGYQLFVQDTCSFIKVSRTIWRVAPPPPPPLWLVWKNAARPWMLIVERSAAETPADYLTRSLRMQRRCSNKATCSNPRNPLITHFLFFSSLIINNYQSIVGKCYWVFFQLSGFFSLRWCYNS